MRARKMRRMLGEAFHVAGVDIVFYIYAVFFIIMAILLLLLEPDIQTLDDLEHLPELSKEELAGLSERIKKFRG